MRYLPLLAAFWLATSMPAQLLRNINQVDDPSTGSTDSDPRVFVEIGGRLYFAAHTAATGRELYSIDGSGSAPVLLADVLPGPGGSWPGAPFELPNGDLMFCAVVPGIGQELWVSDGTSAGTQLLVDLSPPGAFSSPGQFCTFQGNTFFLARSGGSHSMQLWRTDGTTAGTVQLDSLNLTGDYLASEQLLVAGAAGLFCLTKEQLNPGSTSWRLFSSDGSVGGAQVLAQGTSSSVYVPSLAAVGAGVAFSAGVAGSQPEFWISDGTQAGTSPLDLLAGAPGSYPGEFTSLGTQLYFAADTDTQGNGAVFRSDGTLAGTVQVTDLALSRPRPLRLTAAGSVLAFTRQDAAVGGELWVSDGNPGNESLYADFLPGPNSSWPQQVVAYAGGLLCVGVAANGGVELYFSDGTPAGTGLVRDIWPGMPSSDPAVLTAFLGRVYFGANDGVSGRELWSTDATAAGTRLEADLATSPADASSLPSGLVSIGDRVLFAADDGENGVEVWSTDGTTAGTVRLTNAWGSISGVPSGVFTAWNVGGLAVFPYEDELHGRELWASDGTVAGTGMIVDLNPGVSSAASYGLGTWRGELLFASRTAVGPGFDLWATDGTAVGTRPLHVFGQAGEYAYGDPVEVGDQLYFAAYTVNEGSELWRTDGSLAGTSRVVDLVPGAGSSIFEFEAAALGGLLLFAASDASGDVELWRTDGTISGTARVVDLVPFASSDPKALQTVGPHVVFAAGVAGNRHFYGTDGSSVWQLTTTPLGPWSDPQLFHNGRLLLTVLPGANGSQVLWATDGSPQGAGVVREVWPQDGGSQHVQAWRLGSSQKLLFAATSGRPSGPWITDGTPAGTHPLAGGAALGLGAQAFVRLEDQLIYRANDFETGYELYASPFAVLDDWVAQPFGAGCAGATSGLPRLTTSGTATLGATLDVELSEAAPAAAVLHYWSDQFAWTDLGGCRVFLATPSFGGVGTTDAVGASTFALPVPNNPALVGTGLWLQSLVVEPGGAFLGLGGLSPALEVRVGN